MLSFVIIDTQQSQLEHSQAAIVTCAFKLHCERFITDEKIQTKSVKPKTLDTKQDINFSYYQQIKS